MELTTPWKFSESLAASHWPVVDFAVLGHWALQCPDKSIYNNSPKQAEWVPRLLRQVEPRKLRLLHNVIPKGIGGTPRNPWWGFAARFSESWPYFRPKHVIFHTRFLTWPLKSIPIFRPAGGQKPNITKGSRGNVFVGKGGYKFGADFRIPETQMEIEWNLSFFLLGVSEDMACGYWFSKWRTTKSIWVR